TRNGPPSLRSSGSTPWNARKVMPSSRITTRREGEGTGPRLCRGLGSFNEFGEPREGGGIVHGELGQLLAVQLDLRHLEGVDERSVRQPVFPGRGVDPLDPQAAEVPLLVAPIAPGE